MADAIGGGPRPRVAGRLLAPAPAVALGVVVLGATAILAVGAGAYPMRPGEVVAALGVLAGVDDPSVPSQHPAVLASIRLPRVLLAMLVGAALATAGAVLQGLFRNALADPVVIGVSGGAALGAGTAIVLGGSVLAPLVALAGAMLVPSMAFAGALATTAAIVALARVDGRTSLVLLLLVGIAMNALAGAGLGLLSFVATDEQLRNLTFWTLGSVGAATPARTLAVAAFVIPAILLLARLAPALDAMALGESPAEHLGVDVGRAKAIGVVGTALAVGASVAMTGMIAFVGLVAPHLVRIACGPGHRALLPLAALAGATLLVGADLAARTIAAPAELPVGIVTAFVGVPVFVSLLWRQRRHWA